MSFQLRVLAGGQDPKETLKQIGDRYDWTTGAPNDGSEWGKHRVAPHAHPVRDAEMTIKIIFERSSQKGGRQGVRKEGQQGTHLEILLSA